ncbi:hypothetical protein FEF65_01675 [Mariprofundus erugo]|uniref:Uncharacterized protein n=1 Tax=Mariprofundus erugo TaxID=2528639 RepID=A0A5R9GZI9_9PROT|nr:hypothetical protein [Mariprofundus erugo]TLS69217.1 hypothetical protein FEF65_01675 [Mariprofundus erugo]
MKQLLCLLLLSALFAGCHTDTADNHLSGSDAVQIKRLNVQIQSTGQFVVLTGRGDKRFDKGKPQDYVGAVSDAAGVMAEMASAMATGSPPDAHRFEPERNIEQEDKIRHRLSSIAPTQDFPSTLLQQLRTQKFISIHEGNDRVVHQGRDSVLRIDILDWGLKNTPFKRNLHLVRPFMLYHASITQYDTGKVLMDVDRIVYAYEFGKPFFAYEHDINSLKGDFHRLFDKAAYELAGEIVFAMQSADY